MDTCQPYVHIKGFGIPAIGLCYGSLKNREEVFNTIIFEDTLRDITLYVQDVLYSKPYTYKSEDVEEFVQLLKEGTPITINKHVINCLEKEVQPQFSIWAWQLLIQKFVEFTGVTLLFHLTLIMNTNVGWIWKCIENKDCDLKIPVCYVGLMFTDQLGMRFIQCMRDTLRTLPGMYTKDFWFAGCCIATNVLLINGGKNDYAMIHMDQIQKTVSPQFALNHTSDQIIQLLFLYKNMIYHFNSLQ